MKAIILGLMLLSTSVSAGKLKDLYIKTVEDVEIKLMTEGYKILEITNVGFASEAQNSRCDYQMASKAVVVDSNADIINLKCSTCFQKKSLIEAIQTDCK